MVINEPPALGVSSQVENAYALLSVCVCEMYDDDAQNTSPVITGSSSISISISSLHSFFITSHLFV